MEEREIVVENKFFEDANKYITAQQKAEKLGKHEFTCPVCGGNAIWFRTENNGHLRTVCSRCGIAVME